MDYKNTKLLGIFVNITNKTHMRHYLIQATVILATALGVASCDLFFSVVLPTDPSVFVINQNTDLVEVGPEAMEHSIYIASDMSWNAVLKEGTWCSLKQQTYYNEFTSTLVFSVEANTSPERRTDSLIVVSGAQRKALAIVQFGTGDVMDVSEIVLNGTLPIQYQFKASGSWRAEKTGDWFNFSPVSGRGNTIVTFKANDSNVDVQERSGSVVFTLNGVRIEIPVRQQITETLIVNETAVSVDPSGGPFTIGTKTNVDDYSVGIEGNWIKEITTHALLEFEHSFVADPNPTSESRVAHITFAYGDISETVTVTQEGKSPLLDITVPGVYGIAGEDYIYSSIVCQSACVHKGGTRDFRLMTPSRNLAAVLEDVPEELEKGVWMRLPLSVFQSGKAIFARPVDVALESQDDNLIWLRTSSPTAFIILKK